MRQVMNIALEVLAQWRFSPKISGARLLSMFKMRLTRPQTEHQPRRDRKHSTTWQEIYRPVVFLLTHKKPSRLPRRSIHCTDVPPRRCEPFGTSASCRNMRQSSLCSHLSAPGLSIQPVTDLTMVGIEYVQEFGRTMAWPLRHEMCTSRSVLFLECSIKIYTPRRPPLLF